MWNFKMKNVFKKTTILLSLTFILVGLTAPVYFGSADTVCPEGTVIGPNGNSCVPTYQLLAPLPNMGENFNPADQSALGTYLNLMIKLFIGICAVLAVIMIVMGGIEYMTSELISSKEHGKEKITGAIFGLLLALGAWLILSTINPDILKTDLSSLTAVTVEVGIDDLPQIPVNGRYANGAVFGAPWDNTVGQIATLPYGVSVYNSQCSTVGQTNCTSTRGLDVSAVRAIQEGCRCNIQISGGTESWLHGAQTGNTSHMLNSSTVDLRPTPELNQYLSGGRTLVNNQRYPTATGPYRWENNHWHVGP